MSKKQPRKPRTARTARRHERQAACVLDVTIHFSSHLNQHVAREYHVPSVEWTLDDALKAASAVADLLPTPDPVTVTSAIWGAHRGGLSLSISSAHHGHYPFLTVQIADCPLSTFQRCFDGHVAMAHALFSRHDRGWHVRDARQRAPEGISLAPGTIRDEYPDDDVANEERRDRETYAAMQAARKAAGLPLMVKGGAR